MIYGNTFLPEEEKIDENISLESLLMELYDIDCFEEEFVPEIIEEGANREYNDSFREFAKEYRQLSRDIKAYKKAKDKNKYLKTIDKGIELCDKTKKEIDKIQPTTSETVISWILKIAKLALIFAIGLKASVKIANAGAEALGNVTAYSTGAIAGLSGPEFNNYQDKIGKKKNSSKEDKLKRFNQCRTKAINYIYMCKETLKRAKTKAKTIDWD